MTEAIIVSKQILVMFMIIGVGYILRHMNMVSEQGVSSMNSLLVYIAGPAIMITATELRVLTM